MAGRNAQKADVILKDFWRQNIVAQLSRHKFNIFIMNRYM